MTSRSRDRRLGIVLIALTLVAACAATMPHYRNRAEPARADSTDTRACASYARSMVPATFDPFRSAWSVDWVFRHAFDACMQQRGWVRS